MKRLGKKIIGLAVLGLATCQGLAQSASPFGRLPLWFEPVQAGQFIAHGGRATFVISPQGTKFNLARKDGQTASGRLQFVGANAAARITGESQLAGRVNYLLGNNPAAWRAGLPTFARVRLTEIYPGVDVVFYGNQQELEYDFNLAAGVDPSVIKLQFSGAQKLSVNSQGDLLIQFSGGQIVQHAPVVYQAVAGHRERVAANYQVLGRETVGLALRVYNARLPLVIDPILSYSTYYGGNYGETPWAVALNLTDGSVYVAGQTFSTTFTNGIPLSTPGALQTVNEGGKLTGDAFVARFDNSGTNLIYATYLGGTGNDGALGLAVDPTGNAYLTGYTDSSNFPTANAIYPSIRSDFNGNTKTYPVDAFVTELNPAGNGLIYSTYLGGNSMDAAYGLTLDGSGNAYVAGYTYSTNFPVTPEAFQTKLACSNTVYINANAFIAEIAAGGASLQYSTYLGGTNFDVAKGIAFNNDRVFVAGYTWSTNFPNINHLPGFDYLNGRTNKNNYGSDAFVAGFATSLTNWTLLYSTLLGGSNVDAATSIAATADGSAYVAGYTTSTNFPYTTTNVPYLSEPFLRTNKNYVLATNGTLTQITWDGAHPAIGFSTMFGGKGVNVANGVALDPAGNVYVVGSATCTNFPVTTNNISGYLSATNSSQKSKNYSDAFIMAFNSNATALLYSAYLGGRERDYGNAIAVDPVGNAYIVGQTLSTNFPAVNARQTFRNGTNDMFIAKISQATNAPVLTILPQSSTPPGVSLNWRMFPPAYGVESATDLGVGNWSVIPQAPTGSNGWYQITLPATNTAEFFRLRQN